MTLTSFDRQWLLLGTALLLLGGAVGWNLYAEYRDIGIQERERLIAETKVVDENLEHQLIATHHALSSIRSDLPKLRAQKDGLAQLNHRLQFMRDAMPTTRAITVFDAEGTLIARSPDKFVGQNFSKRDYFQIARQGGNANTLYVAPPFLAATGEHVLNMAKVLLNERGTFAGIILVSLGPEYFSTLLKSLLYAPDMQVTLMHGDSKVIFSVSGQKDLAGADVPPISGTFFSQHMKDGQQTSIFDDITAPTDEVRLGIFRTIHPAAVPMDKPLVIAITRAVSSIFAPWRENVVILAVFILGLTLVTTTGLYAYQQRRKIYSRLIADQEAERKRAEEALRQSEETFKKLFADSADPILLMDNRGLFVECNQAALNLLKMTREEFLLLPPARISPEFQPDGQRSADAAPEMIALAYSKGLHRFDWTHFNAEGGEFIVDISLMPITLKGQIMLHVMWRDITERKATAAKIQHLAFFDFLTNLPNRRLLLDRLAQALASSARHGRYGAVILLDMDDFKTLNDTLGHDVGDQFLVEVANRLRAIVREGDTVARLGGDEFILIVKDLGEDATAAMRAESVAVKILHAVSQPYQLNLSGLEGTKGPGSERSYSCTSSIGITLFHDNSIPAEELLKRADTSMYQAKAAGRNTLRFFDATMQEIVAARADLDNDLREAVRQHQFCLYYQPQVDAAGRRTGAEALLRWRHPTRGMVSPLEFIPQAEENGLILPIGHWVIETACAQLARWAEQPENSHLAIAVNVSARQFRDDAFVERVLAIIDSTGADPAKLKLELTESLLLDNVGDIILKMEQLKAQGIRFSLDDFGTGYSSLSYLKRLPIEQLKIDRSFIKDVLTDPDDATIARTIVALTQSMGLKVIAEGVETEAQRDYLATMGCLAYQGYLFGKPMPVEEFVGE